jgi:hypothetical protein
MAEPTASLELSNSVVTGHHRLGRLALLAGPTFTPKYAYLPGPVQRFPGII